MECVEKLIKKDMINPLSGATLKESDIIPLQKVRHVPQISPHFYAISQSHNSGLVVPVMVTRLLTRAIMT